MAKKSVKAKKASESPEAKASEKPTVGAAPPLTTSAGLWGALQERGGLNLALYDESLVADLRKHLSLPEAGAFADQLATIKVERFVEALFGALEPYSQMFADILAMFERANATSNGAAPLEVEFDFGEVGHALKFNLEQFRRYVRRWRRATGVREVEWWTYPLLMQLRQAFGAVPGGTFPQVHGLDAWLAEYDDGKWPDTALGGPEVADPTLQSLIDRAWNVFGAVLDEARRHGAQRTALASATYLPRDPHNVASVGLPLDDRWMLKRLEVAEWATQFVRAAHGGLWRGAPDSLQASLTSVFDQVQHVAVTITDRLINELLSILDIPIWKFRHELYSLWIGAQIIDELGPKAQIHAPGRRLEIKFSGTHLATLVIDDNVRLHLMAEIRHPLTKPKGKGRRAGVQPDYLLSAEPLTDRSRVPLVVECKQYLNGASTSFAAALTDYARALAKAEIVLVNYGDCSEEAVVKKIDASLVARTVVVPTCRPGPTGKVARLRERVRRVVEATKTSLSGSGAPAPTAPPQSAPPPDPAAVGTGAIRLTWGDSPSDLDLHVWVKSASGIDHVDYKQKGNLSGPPWALLDEDQMTGNGVETVTLSRLSGRLRCAVHMFSNDGRLSASDAKIRADLGGIHVDLRCPPWGDGEWWKVFDFDPVNRQLEIHNEIVAEVVCP